ncbi:MAG: autotransporter outer membrane beta-barrel domain-containing protein [Verrucomicrobiales bacterium]|nr:autotransporter outer membrane beta-barrel domain-containing protein [Verrucomicrobiales bacterium]
MNFHPGNRDICRWICMVALLAAIQIPASSRAQNVTTATTTTTGTWDTLGASFTNDDPYRTSGPWALNQYIRPSTGNTPFLTSRVFNFTPLMPTLPTGAYQANLVENRISMTGLTFRPDNGDGGGGLYDPTDFATYTFNGIKVADLYNAYTTANDASPLRVENVLAGTTFVNLVNGGGGVPTNSPIFLITTGYISVGTDTTFTYELDFVQNNSATSEALIIDAEADIASTIGGITGLVLNIQSDWEFLYYPVITVTDLAAIDQLNTSAIPMNMAVGRMASDLHRTGLRDFNQRIYRLRQRTAGGGGMADAGNSFRRGRTVSASRRFREKDADLNFENTINLSGHKPTPTSGGSTTRRRSDGYLDNPLLPSVTQEAELYYYDTYGRKMQASSGRIFEKWDPFVSVDFGDYNLNSMGTVNGFNSRTYAASAGLEYEISSCLSIGAGWSHAMNDNTLKNGTGKADLEGDTVVGYASYFHNNFWGDLLYGQGNYGVDISRNTLGSIVTATPDLTAKHSALNLGYNIPCGSGFVHGPTLRADYSWGELEGYTETGNARANAIFAPQAYDSLISTLGWQFNWNKSTCWGFLRPQLRVGYGRENIDQETSVTGTLQNSPVSIIQGPTVTPGAQYSNTLTTENDEAGWVEVGAGIAFDFHNNFSLHFDYQGRFLQEEQQLHLGSIKATWGY